MLECEGAVTIYELKDFMGFESLQAFERAADRFKWRIQSGLGGCFPMDEFEIGFMATNACTKGITSRQRVQLQHFFTEKLSELCVAGNGDPKHQFIGKWIEEKASEAVMHIETVVLTAMAVNERKLTLGGWYDLAYNAISYHFNLRDYHYPHMLDDFEVAYPVAEDEFVNNFCSQISKQGNTGSVHETKITKDTVKIYELQHFVHFETEEKFERALGELEAEIKKGFPHCFPLDSGEIYAMMQCRDVATSNQEAELWDFLSEKLMNFCIAGNGDAKNPFIRHWVSKKTEEAARHIDTMVTTIMAVYIGDDLDVEKWHCLANWIIALHFGFSADSSFSTMLEDIYSTFDRPVMVD